MKDTISSVLIAGSAAIASLLGLIHLLCTFRGQNLQPLESDLMAKMKTVSLFISRDTTVWRTWIGFNASHSFSLIFFGAVYGYPSGGALPSWSGDQSRLIDAGGREVRCREIRRSVLDRFSHAANVKFIPSA
jgi:hypothetical protein